MSVRKNPATLVVECITQRTFLQSFALQLLGNKQRSMLSKITPPWFACVCEASEFVHPKYLSTRDERSRAQRELCSSCGRLGENTTKLHVLTSGKVCPAHMCRTPVGTGIAVSCQSSLLRCL